MISQSFNSFTDNIIQKTKNPFFGTFIIIWGIRNWKFIYSIFFFDDEEKLDSKIKKIESFFVNYGFKEVIITLFFTFLLLISTYILLNVSRLIVNFFEKVITPKVYEISDKSSIVLKDDYIKIQNEIAKLENKIREERELRLKVQNENETLEKRIAELLVPKINSENNFENENNIFSEKIKLLVKKLQSDNKVDSFNNIASNILSGYAIEKTSEDVKLFINLGLIKPGSHTGSGKYLFTFTNSGQEVHEILLMENLK